MANDFSGDANCKAVWRFESGALTADSKGTNTLTDNGTVGTDTTNFREGAASADFELSNSEYFSITDANLDSGFPYKSDDTTKKCSVCFWIRPESSTTFHCVLGSYDSLNGFRSWQVQFQDRKISWVIGYNSGNNIESEAHASQLTLGQWYHVGITFDDSDGSFLIRVWDDTAGDFLGTDKSSPNFSNNISLTTHPVHVASRVDATNFFDGNLDEVVIFNDILTTDEIDEIRSGTYGDSILPNKLTISLNDAVSSFSGKIGNSGVVNTNAGSATINNSGQDGKNGIVDTDIDPLTVSNLAYDGKTGFIDFDLQVIVKLLGLESIVVFAGVLNSQLMDNVFSLNGNISQTGNLTLQVENIINALTGFKGVSGIADINVFTDVQILAKLGIKGDINILLADMGVKLIEVTVSDRIFQILISTKTGQISILKPKTGQINITTQ